MGKIFTDKDLESHISSKLCRICGNAADGWRCPKCGIEANQFEPFHWKGCEFRAKMETKCKECQQAESLCTCLTPK